MCNSIMGFFDFITNPVKKLVKGVKSGAGKVAKGVKRQFGSGFTKGFQRGLRTVGRALQKPAEYIKSKDPLAKKMGGAGFLSPQSLITDIALAPVSGIGYLEELAGSPEKQRKLRSGDLDTALDTGFAGLSLVPMGLVGGGAKKLGRGIKGGVKRIARGIGNAIR